MRTPEPLYSLTVPPPRTFLARRPPEARAIDAEVLVGRPVIGVLIVVPERPAPALPPPAPSERAVASARAVASYASRAELACPTGLLVRVRA